MGVFILHFSNVILAEGDFLVYTMCYFTGGPKCMLLNVHASVPCHTVVYVSGIATNKYRHRHTSVGHIHPTCTALYVVFLGIQQVLHRHITAECIALDRVDLMAQVCFCFLSILIFYSIDIQCAMVNN